MADAVVDVGLGGEGDALGDLLVLLVDLVRLLDDHVVTDLAELECRNSDNAPLDQIFQNAKKSSKIDRFTLNSPVGDITSHLVLGNDQIVGNGELLIIGFGIGHFQDSKS